MAYQPQSGSVVAFQGNPSVLQVLATITNPGTIGSVSGAVTAPPGSVMAVSATFPAGSIATVVNPAASVTAVRTDSASVIAVIQGSSVLAVPVGSTIAVLQSSSILAVPVGSVITIWQSPSIVGTYSEDAGHTTADKGIFVLAVRNDTVASTASADTDYTIHAVDSAGRVLMKPFAAEEARVEGYNSVVSGSVTTLVAAAGTGIRNYITDLWLANTGSVATLVTFVSAGGASILGYTIAPAGGGSNIIGLAMPIRTGANATFDIQATTSTSVLYATVKGYKAP